MRRVLLGALIVSVLAAGAGYLWLAPRAVLGAGYTAKELCSCVYVGGRTLDACRPDLFGGAAERVRSELLEAPPGVRAWVPLFAERVAHYEPRFGCTLQPR